MLQAVAHKGSLIQRMQNGTCLTQARLLVDFARKHVRSALPMLDRRFVVKVFGPLPDSDVRRFVLRGVVHVAALLNVEEPTAVLQYNSVGPYMLHHMAPSQLLAGKTNP